MAGLNNRLKAVKIPPQLGPLESAGGNNRRERDARLREGSEQARTAHLSDAIGRKQTFMWSAIAAFSACASGLMILMLLLLPETRGRSLADLDGAAPAALGGESAAVGGGSN